MREIKFKAVLHGNITPVDWVDFATKKCGFTSFSGGTNEHEEYEIKFERLIQSTGLHDKNGVEIYEGDILEVMVPEYDDKPSPNPPVTGSVPAHYQVCFEFGCFVARKYGIVFSLDTISKKAKVSRNVYENTEKTS